MQLSLVFILTFPLHAVTINQHIRRHLADSGESEPRGDDQSLFFELQLGLGIPVHQSWRPGLDNMKEI